MRYFIIGDEDAVIGFKLAGVTEAVAVSPDDYVAGERELKKAIERDDIGLVIINAPFLANVSEQMRKKIDALARPIIITIPDRKGEGAESDSLRHMVKRALGVDLFGKNQQNDKQK